jgi:transcription-repair coupling factor (superfamily II helicase)
MIIRTESNFLRWSRKHPNLWCSHAIVYWNAKKITIIPNVENKVFRKTEKVSDYISEKTVIFIQNTEDFLSQLDKQFGKAEEAAKLSQEIKRSTPEQLFLNQAQFI